MSRTRKGSKPPGYEYWSKRPGNKHGGLLGVRQKKFTHRAERKQGKDQCRDNDGGGYGSCTI